jgi:hypothetical protein
MFQTSGPKRIFLFEVPKWSRSDHTYEEMIKKNVKKKQ